MLDYADGAPDEIEDDPDEILAQEFWGWDDEREGGVPGRMGYRVPLPPTRRFPVVIRGATWEGCAIKLPPYLCARWIGDRLQVMPCDGRGVRAGCVLVDADSGEVVEGPGGGVYNGEPGVPEEWEEPIREAIEEVRRRYPDAKLTFR